MHRFAHPRVCGLMLTVAAAAAGCSSGAGGLITGSAAPVADSPGALSNDSPLARPVAVAWTSARAERCGFYFDPTKLRASYLASEAKQSSPEQVAKAQQVYDTTFKLIGQRVAQNGDYCTDRKSAEIKDDLQRHLAGDFTPKLPQAKKVETCGFFGCAPASAQEKWDTEKWWSDEASKRISR